MNHLNTSEAIEIGRENQFNELEQLHSSEVPTIGALVHLNWLADAIWEHFQKRDIVIIDDVNLKHNFKFYQAK